MAAQKPEIRTYISAFLQRNNIPVSTAAPNLGFIFDSAMSLTNQVNFVCKSSHFYIYVTSGTSQIWFLHPFQSPWLILCCRASLTIAIHYILAWASRTSRNSSVFKILLFVSLHKLQSFSTELLSQRSLLASHHSTDWVWNFSYHFLNHHECPAVLLASIAYTSDTLINQIISYFCSFQSKN